MPEIKLYEGRDVLLKAATHVITGFFWCAIVEILSPTGATVKMIFIKLGLFIDAT